MFLDIDHAVHNTIDNYQRMFHSLKNIHIGLIEWKNPYKTEDFYNSISKLKRINYHGPSETKRKPRR